MQPQFSVGSLIYVAPTDPETIQPGQAITFEKESGSIVTHQVYEVDHNNGLIYTQGIANQDQNGNILHDADPVPYSHVIGVPVFLYSPAGLCEQFLHDTTWHVCAYCYRDCGSHSFFYCGWKQE